MGNVRAGQVDLSDVRTYRLRKEVHACLAIRRYYYTYVPIKTIVVLIRNKLQGRKADVHIHAHAGTRTTSNNKCDGTTTTKMNRQKEGSTSSRMTPQTPNGKSNGRIRRTT